MFEKLMPALMVAFPGIYGGQNTPPFAKGGTFLDLSSPIGQFLYFNKVTKRFDTLRNISLSEMYNLIEYHEKRQQGRIPPSINNDRLIRDIQNSKSGSIRMQFPLNALIPNQPGSAMLELFFQKKASRDNSRKMTNIGPPMYTGGTKTPAGTSYAGAGTRDHQANSAANTGSYLPQAEGGSKNPYNSTTAPLKLHYNSTDKVFEAGTTQTLAKLLTDLPGADVNKSAPSPTALGTNNSDFYDPKGRYYSGNFTTGLAMPLNIEHGNPHLFGPNIIECQEKKIEKIRVVNRSPKSFYVGEVIMLSSLNGEWVASSLGEAITKPRPASAQDWAFCKMIVDSDSYFKDGRYYSEDDYENYNQSITSDFYELVGRMKFFYGGDESPFGLWMATMSQYESTFGFPGMATALAIFNYDTRKTVKDQQGKEIANPNWVGSTLIYPPGSSFEGMRKNFQPSSRYIATTIFDLLGVSQGGFLANETKKVNHDYSINKINAFDETFTEFTSMSEIFPFWGPVFTDGYRSISTSQINLLTNHWDSLYFSRSVDPTPFMSDLKNVPAEISSKIIDIVSTRDSLIDLGGPRSNTCRTNILYPPYYYSSPISTTHIQFIPLTDTLVGHTDVLTNALVKYKNERNFGQQVYGPNGLFDEAGMTHMAGDGLHGNIATRNSHIPLRVNFSSQDYWMSDNRPRTACLTDNYGIFNGTAEAFAGFKKDVTLIPYDCYVRRPTTNIALGAPQYFRDTGDYLGANCVGVIAGMCVITKDGGGDINFELKQDVGLAAQPTDVVSTIDLISVIGGLLLGGGSSGGVSYDNPQWGSSDDDIDSFGTTALHIRIFDDWEDRDTFFDPRYFAVLHFNPVPDPNAVDTKFRPKGYYPALGDLARSEPAGSDANTLLQSYGDNWGNLYALADGHPPPTDDYGNSLYKTLSYEERPKHVEQIESSVDFRVPTLDTASTLAPDARRVSALSSTDLGIALKPGETINKYSQLRPENDWRVNTIRRGQILTGGGFYYYKNVIGLNTSNGYWVNRGGGFKPTDVIECANNIKITVISVTEDGKGGINELEFYKEETEIPYLKNAGSPEYFFGEGFTPGDFASSETASGRTEIIKGESVLGTCYSLTIPSPTEGADAAVIEFVEGKVWTKLMWDAPPKEHVPKTRISVGSKKGQIGRTADLAVQQSVSLTLDPNESGDYRLFTFFHNDIGSTPATGRTFPPGYIQYMDLNIT